MQYLKALCNVAFWKQALIQFLKTKLNQKVFCLSGGLNLVPNHGSQEIFDVSTESEIDK